MKRLSTRALLLGATLAGLTFSLVAAAKLSKSGSASVSFLAVGPAGMKIEGKSSDLKVSDDGDNVKLVVSVASFVTGIELRDKHMKEKYLEVGTYPDAELSIARSALKFPDSGASASAEAKGSLKLHGQTKDVTVKYTAKKDGDTFDVTASTRVNMKDFGIEVPSYLGVTVKPDVDVSAAFKAADN